MGWTEPRKTTKEMDGGSSPTWGTEDVAVQNIKYVFLIFSDRLKGFN